jgi:hypothetical protein
MIRASRSRALYGLLIKIRDLGLPLLAMARQRGGVEGAAAAIRSG